jgi:hypothetical protein
MTRESVWSTEPFHIITGCAWARKDTQVEWNIVVPLPVVAALLHALTIACLWYEREKYLHM